MEYKLKTSISDLAVQAASFAIGNDLVCLSNFKFALTELFKAKVYTDKEKAYCDSFSDEWVRYASTWAAKEAVYKALKQLDTTPIGWKKIEILREKASGKPKVVLPPSFPPYQISLTISHDGDYVWALAFIHR